MYRWGKTLREDRYMQERKKPSFSSSLLDEIYRSTDDGSTKSPDLKFYRETMQRKQSKSNVKSKTNIDEEQMSSLHRACLIEKWMDKKVSEKANVRGRQILNEYERKLHLDHDHDQDVLFFSSTSSSSDSSSGGFSSSDTDSFYGSRSGSFCFAPQRPKPVRTSISAQPEKTKKKERTLFHEQREPHMFDDYHYNSAAEHTPKLEESDLIKSKSRALKIYSNLKKVKQPISPGGRLANFLNSLFTAGNAKKTKNSSSLNTSYDDVTSKSGQVSTCSSTSSFSRSCLSKSSPSTRERLRNGVKRSVRFYPVSVIVDEDCRPCGHKRLYEEEEETSLMSVSVSTAWKIRKSPSRKKEDELKVQVMERSERVGDMARELLKNYHQNQKKSDLVSRDIHVNYDHDQDEDDDEDDAASYSSSDLFELDHLAVIGNNRYCEELPVYETTHVDTNRAIANGLIM